jgi:hypothetical protein
MPNAPLIELSPNHPAEDIEDQVSIETKSILKK